MNALKVVFGVSQRILWVQWKKGALCCCETILSPIVVF